MSIYKIINGERIKLRHHIMVEMRENVSFTVQTEDSGCERQEFNSSSLKPLIKFSLGDVIVNLDENKVQAWYMAASVKDFFKVKIRIEEPYVRNLSKIEDEISRAFLDMPCDLVRGARLQDIPGNITSKTVFGMKKYSQKISRRTLETIELIGVDETEEYQKIRTFDYWAFDQEMFDSGFISMVGYENGIQFLRKIEIGSLLGEDNIVTAYIRPCFCEEYSI